MMGTPRPRSFRASDNPPSQVPDSNRHGDDLSSGPQDGSADHTGIVEKVENGKVYTVEGNTGDSCAERQYTIGHYEILGYGAPAY